MGLSQDLKEFSAGMATGFQLTSNLREKAADREEKRADRAERSRIADQNAAITREINDVPTAAETAEAERIKAGGAPVLPTTDAGGVGPDVPKPNLPTTDKGGVGPDVPKTTKTATNDDADKPAAGATPVSMSTGEKGFVVPGGSGKTPRQPSGSVKARGQRLVDKFISLGYTPAAAAGIAGNIQQESSFNPSVRPGDKGTAHGLAQWRGGRWANMQKYAASKGKSPYDFDTQVEFIDYEMGTRDGGGIRDRMRKETDPRRAADLFALKYERPQGAQTGNANNIHGINNRRTWANAFFDPNAKPGTTYAGSSDTGAIPRRGGGFRPVGDDTLQDDTAQQEPVVQPTLDAGTGGDTDDGGSRRVAQVDVSTGGTGNDYITGDAGTDQIAVINPYDEEPVLWGARGGAIPTRYFAAAGKVDKYNPSRSFTQAVPQAPASTFVPRKVGTPAPVAGQSGTASGNPAGNLPAGTGYGLGQVTPRQQALRDKRIAAAAPPPAAAAANKGTGKFAWSAEYGDEPTNTFTEGQKAQMAAGNQPFQAWNSTKEGREQAADWQRWKLGENRYREINTYSPQQFYADQEAWRWGAPTSSKFDIRYRPVGSPAQDTGGPGYAEGGTVRPSYEDGGSIEELPVEQPVLAPRYAQGGIVVGGNRPYDDDPDSARERLIKRNAAAQGLTQGDIDRARSDPSRYGEIHLPDEEKPAVRPRAEPKRAKPKAEPKKAEPKKVTPEPKYTKEEPARPPDPVEPPRDEPGPRTYPAPAAEPEPYKTHDELGNVIATEGTEPLTVAKPTSVKTDALGNVIEAGGEGEVVEDPAARQAAERRLPGDPSRNPYETRRAPTPVPPALVNRDPRPGISTLAPDPNLPAPAIPPQSEGPPDDLNPYPPPPPVAGPARVPPTAPPRDPNLPPPEVPDQAIRPPLVPTREGVPTDRPDAMRVVRPAIPGRTGPPDNPNAQPELGGGPSDTQQVSQADLPAEGATPVQGESGKPGFVVPPAPVNLPPKPGEEPTIQGEGGDDDLSGKKREEGQKIINPDKKGQPAGTAVTRAMDHLEAQIRGDDQRQGPAIGPDAQRQGRLNNYLNGNNQQGTQAMSSQEYKEIAKTVDPQGKLDIYERNIKMYQDLEDYWISKGYPKKAAEATLGLTLYNKKVAQNAGGMALAALDAGDTVTAAQWMTKAYAHVPNNQSLRVEPTEDGKGVVYSIIDRGTGQVIQKPTYASAEQMGQMASGLLSGKMFDDEMLKIAEETKGGKGRAGTATKKGPTESEISRDEREAMGGIADATVELGKAGDEKGFNQGIEEARQKARRLSLNTDETNKFLSDIYKRAGVPLPDYLVEEPKTKEDRAAAAHEKEDAATQKEIDEAEKSGDGARYSRALNKRANIAFQRQKDDESINVNTEAFQALEPGPDKEFLSAYGHQILRKNRMDADHAMRTAKNLTDPTKKLDIGKDGRVTLQGEPLRLYLSDEMLQWIGRKRADALKNKKAA